MKVFKLAPIMSASVKRRVMEDEEARRVTYSIWYEIQQISIKQSYHFK